MIYCLSPLCPRLNSIRGCKDKYTVLKHLFISRPRRSDDKSVFSERSLDVVTLNSSIPIMWCYRYSKHNTRMSHWLLYQLLCYHLKLHFFTSHAKYTFHRKGKFEEGLGCAIVLSLFSKAIQTLPIGNFLSI